MAIEYSSRTLFELCQSAVAGEILLPNFQRGFVWPSDQQFSIGASVLLGIPSGSLLLIAGKQGDYDCREIGSKRRFQAVGPELPCEFLLDGQQRLTSLRQMFGDPLKTDWATYLRNTYAALKSRWSIQVRPASEGDEDLFGYWDLRFDGLPVEPELVTEALNRHSIYIGSGHNHWYHPAFNEDLGTTERSLSVGRRAALDGAVPLWGVLENEVSALRAAIRDLATKRFEDLCAKLQDGTADLLLVTELAEMVGADHGSSVDVLTEALRERKADWQNRVTNYLVGIREYRPSTIRLSSDELDKAIVIFEAINRGGQPLKAFDLVSARYAKGDGASGTSLPMLITEAIGALDQAVPLELSQHCQQWTPPEGMMATEDELTPGFKTPFLQVLAASQVTTDVAVDDFKQSRFMRLQPDEIASGWSNATTALAHTWRFLQLRCGLPTENSLRNKLLVLPIALVLGDPEIPATSQTYNRLEYWYWASVLTSTYSSRQNENCVIDIGNLRAWLKDSALPNPFKSRGDRVLADPKYSDRDTLLRIGEETVGTDVGLYLLQSSAALGGMDLLERRRLHMWSDDLEDHHLIPLATVTTVGQSSRDIRKGSDELSRVLNSPLNRAYVLKATNRTIAARSIDQYMQDVGMQVTSSLGFAGNPFTRNQGETNIEYARRVLGVRFDNLRTQMTNHLSLLDS